MKRISSHLLAPVLIVALVTAAYSTSLNGVFVFDDYTAILKSPNVVSGEAAFSGHRWLVDLSFRANYMLDATDAIGYHIVNLLIHLGAALFLYGAVRRTMLLKWKLSSDAKATAVGMAIALLWGIHPLTTQAVTYVCQRYESMMGMFAVGAFYFFVRGLSGRHVRMWFNLSIVMTALGMGCKEVMVVVPALLLVYDYVFSGRSIPAIIRERGLYHLASFLTILLLMFYQLQLAADQMTGVNAGTRISDVSWWSYLYTQGTVIWHYIKLAFVPIGLCFDYFWRPEPLGMSGIVACSGHAAVLLLFVIAVARRIWWGFPGILFYVVLAPTSSVVPVFDIAAEHRMYLALMPLVGGFVWFLYVLSRAACSRWPQHLRHSSTFMISVVATALTLGQFTATRNMVYWSELSLWKDTVSRRPENLRAGNILAVTLSRAGKVDEAIEEYERVISAVPTELRERIERGEAMVQGIFSQDMDEYVYFMACANLGTMYCNERRNSALALQWYVRALKVAPSNPDVRAKAKRVLPDVGNLSRDSALDREIAESIKRSVESSMTEQSE